MKGFNWPSSDPGAKQHQIVILRQVAGTDISGAITTWVPFLATWAAIDYVRGTDVLKAGQQTTQSYLTVRMNYRAGVASNMRVQAPNGANYVIQSIENVKEMNAELVLSCLALGANDI